MHNSSSLRLQQALLICASLIGIAIAAYWLWTSKPQISEENGLLESGQDLFLLLACATHLYQSSRNPPNGLSRHLRWGLALFCFALLLRELDIDRIGAAQAWGTIERLVRSLTLIALLVYLGFMVKKGNALWCNITRIFVTPTVALTIIGCICYLAGWPFDKLKLPIATNLSVLIEETLELNACVLFFFAACARGYFPSTVETAKNKQNYLAEI